MIIMAEEFLGPQQVELVQAHIAAAELAEQAGDFKTATQSYADALLEKHGADVETEVAPLLLGARKVTASRVAEVALPALIGQQTQRVSVHEVGSGGRVVRVRYHTGTAAIYFDAGASSFFSTATTFAPERAQDLKSVAFEMRAAALSGRPVPVDQIGKRTPREMLRSAGHGVLQLLFSPRED